MYPGLWEWFGISTPGSGINRPVIHVPQQRPIDLPNRTGKVISRGRGRAQSLASTRVYHHDEWPLQSGADVRSETSSSEARSVAEFA